MHLLLITASSKQIKRIRKSRVIGFQQMTMPYLAALTPPHWKVEHIDEDVEDVDFNKDINLVGITFHTPSAAHAYDIAAKFRLRGVPVVLGGPHVTLLPEEASDYADVIIVGEAEHIWPQFLREFEQGTHQNRYELAEPPAMEQVPSPRKDLFHRRDYSNGIVCATRGCPNKCEFCTISIMYKNSFRKRSIQRVAEEYGSHKGKVIIFWDDNISADLDYAKDLFRAITPYRKWWSSQASVQAGKDEEFLELAAKSGCKQLFIGIESISQLSLNRANKGFNKVEEYYKVIRRIHSYGIAVQTGVVFGFDDDDNAIFEDTIAFLEEAGVQNSTFNILTPYPGTPLFKRLDAEGRILTYNWSKYNARTDVVYAPKKMSSQELLDGFKLANKTFYSVSSISKRLAKSPTGLWWTLPLNLMYSFSWRLYGYHTITSL